MTNEDTESKAESENFLKTPCKTPLKRKVHFEESSIPSPLKTPSFVRKSISAVVPSPYTPSRWKNLSTPVRQGLDFETQELVKQLIAEDHQYVNELHNADEEARKNLEKALLVQGNKEYLEILKGKETTYTCDLCGEETQIVEVRVQQSCGHILCECCLYSYLLEAMGAKQCLGLQCPVDGCIELLEEALLKETLSENELARFTTAWLDELVDSSPQYVRCPGPTCSQVLEILPAEDDGDMVLPLKYATTTQPLSAAARSHLSQYRLRCPQCSLEFCGSCFASPYHAGYTCLEYKAFLEAQHCRYCGKTANLSLPSQAGGDDAQQQGGDAAAINPLLLVCDSEECISKSRLACQRILPCGHPCPGVAGEEICPGCLHPDCATSQCGDDYCNICWVESLEAAPSLRLKCGHWFHFACLKERIKRGWATPHIGFSFLDCPICKTSMKHPLLRPFLKPFLKLRAKVMDKARQRLVYEGRDHDPAVGTGGPFEGQMEEYALTLYNYYLCFQCKTPYFGGMRACGAGPPEEADEQGVLPREELLCVPCRHQHEHNESAALYRPCPKHGYEFVEFKCKFCCNTASWFCWGTTHFCDDCHKIAPIIARRPKHLLPKCTCGRPHPPNGTNHCWGCSLCAVVKNY